MYSILNFAAGGFVSHLALLLQLLMNKLNRAKISHLLWHMKGFWQGCKNSSKGLISITQPKKK